jgi:hypothetical protein
MITRSQTPGRVDQLQEIESVKRALAKTGTPCSVGCLQTALLAPEELNLTQELDLPRSGMKLMVNPFTKVGGLKRAKKKGKRKGKRGRRK